MLDTFSTVEDLAERWHVSRDAISGFISSGELKAINIARSKSALKARWRIAPEAVAEFEAARSTVKPTEPPQKNRRATNTKAEKNWY